MLLIDFLTQHIRLSEETKMAIDLVAKREVLPKGQQLLEPQNFSQKVFFFEEGFARVFYLKEDKSITQDFLSENTFYTAVESVFYQKQSPYALELLEKSTVISLQFHSLQQLVEKFPILDKIMIMVLIDVLHKFSERMTSIQFQTAAERYKNLLNNHPDILQKAPLGHIASYLGITQQTLSVIRGQKR